MAHAQKQTMHFWAFCPHCPSDSSRAAFPITVEVRLKTNFDIGGGTVEASWDSNPVLQHMEDLHSDLLQKPQLIGS
jgi:hypothetical protein